MARCCGPDSSATARPMCLFMVRTRTTSFETLRPCGLTRQASLGNCLSDIIKDMQSESECRCGSMGCLLSDSEVIPVCGTTGASLRARMRGTKRQASNLNLSTAEISPQTHFRSKSLDPAHHSPRPKGRYSLMRLAA